MFIDQAVITVRSGKGGDGAIHFRREKYVPRGGPDGGDGGRGGSIILEVKPTLNTLSTFRHKHEFKAENGSNGARQNMSGKSAENLVIVVPPGTMVFDDGTAELLGDLTEAGQQLVVCKGGRGGRGNQHFATPSHQAPRIAEKGEPGEERVLRFELKLIADIGIVGAPNAGKSTLLSVVTNAKPKIAPYPFTTLEPNLGVANLDDETSLILADIPGLIEGAHAGIGLGHDFLRHIQRTRVLIHLLDGAAENPVLDFAQINSELALFDPALASKPQIVGVNKMDLDEAQARWTQIERALKKRGYEALAISAATGQNVRALLYRAAQLLQEAPQAVDFSQEASSVETVETPGGTMPVYRPESDPRAFTVTQTEEGWRVSGAAVERAAAMTYWDEYQSIRRFQRILKTLGVEDALRKAGVQTGDTVMIGEEFELEWQD